ncbi:oxidoreductase, aldo/keto reductase family [Klebsiella aerogenes]|nr:oxidoreductase, aldo/keto reductase family [Klebsiella aerogenes]
MQKTLISGDFSLTDSEMALISALDLGYVGEAVKHFNPEFVRGCLGVKKQ